MFAAAGTKKAFGSVNEATDVQASVMFYTPNIAKKTGLNDRLINYTMSFDKSFSLVNNIR